MVRDCPGNYPKYGEWVKLENDNADFRPPGDGYKAPEKKPVSAAPAPTPASQPEKKKLTYKEKREFELLEKEIADLEKEKQQVTDKLNGGSAPFTELQQLPNRSEEISPLLDEKEIRSLELTEPTK